MVAISLRKPGDVLAIRGIWRQKLWYAGPVILVQENPDLIAVYWQAGTRVKQTRKRATAQDLLNAANVELVDHIWSETDVLMLAIPGEAHSAWAMWEAGQPILRCWYVNLEMPLQRTSLGFDTMDQELDIVISPDRSAWHWKDEEAFAEMVAAGVFSRQEAAAIRAEGERVIQQMLANEPPFCDGWENWSPPTEWAIPQLPSSWDEIQE